MPRDDCVRRSRRESRPAATHWAKTFNLIEETVFQREDLFAAEGIQAGLRSGANKAITLGRLEGSVQHFHATIERALEARD